MRERELLERDNDQAHQMVPYETKISLDLTFLERVVHSASPRTHAPSRRLASEGAKSEAAVALVYSRHQGVDAFLKQVHEATPMQIVEIERQGVAGTFIADLSERMALPASRVFGMLRIPKATAARKAAEGAVIDGRAGQAAVGMVKLLGIARDIVDDSTAEGAQEFDAVKWLGRWIERPQPALGGRKPADLLDTPTGIEMVARVLGALQSGAYQ